MSSPIAKLTAKTEVAPLKKSRKRGLVLTEQGWQKLLQAGVIYNPVGDLRSLEELSEKTLLDPRTIYRTIDRKVSVDKRTLNIFFEAFNLQLEQGDYTSLITSSATTIAVSQPLQDSALNLLEHQYSAEELAYLKQCIIKDCCDLISLLELDNVEQKILSVKLDPQTTTQLEIIIHESC